MIVANRATLSGIVRTPFLFFPLPGKGFLAAFIAVFTSACHGRHWALVGSDIELLTRGLFKAK
jgi:hypothetical protein